MAKKIRESKIPHLVKAVESIKPGSSDIVMRALGYIGAPDHLPALYWVVANIGTILPFCHELKDESIEAYRSIEQLVEIIEALKAVPEYEHDNAYSLNYIEKKGVREPPFHGINTSHPVYCSLWYKYRCEGELAKSYQRLQAQFLSAYALLKHKSYMLRSLDNQIRNAGRFLRQISTHEGSWFSERLSGAVVYDKKKLGRRLASLYHAYGDRRAQIQLNIKLVHRNRRLAGLNEEKVENNNRLNELNKAEQNKKQIEINKKQIRQNELRIKETQDKIGENEQKIKPEVTQGLLEPVETYAGSFAVILHKCWPEDVRSPHKRRKGGSGGGGNSEFKRKMGINPEHQMWALLSEESGSDPGIDALPWTPPKRQPGKKGYEDEEEDIPNNEWDEDDENVLVNSDRILGDANNDPKTLPPLSTLMMAARVRARYISMANQRFRTERHRIRPWQAKCILKRLEVFTEQAYEEAEAPAIETALLSAVMVVTSSTFDAARQIILANDKSELPDEYTLAYSPRYDVFVRPAIYHPIKSLLAKNSGVIEEWGEHIVLHGITKVGGWLSGYVEDKGVKPGENIFFKRRIKTFERLYKDNVGKHLNNEGFSLRWQKISGAGNVFHDWLVTREEGSAVIPALISGRTDLLGDVPLYYTSIGRKQLMDVYVDAWRDFVEAVVDEGYVFKDGGLFIKYERSNRKIEKNTGAQEVVTFSTVKELLKTEYQKIDGFKALPNDQFHMRAHNTLTSYVGFALAIVTGFRAVYTPILDITKYDSETGFMALQEKDQLSKCHGRIVWLPVPIRQLIEGYVAHLQALAKLRGKEHGYCFQIKLTKNRDKGKGGKVEIDMRRCLFYIDDDGNDIEFSGNRLRDKLGDAYVSNNAGRRFLRSALINKECPEAIIHAVMGHWGRGEEIWGKNSTFDPRIYRKELARYLNELLDDIGFNSLNEYRQLQ